MLDTAISVENLSKEYTIGHVLNNNLRDAFSSFFKSKRDTQENIFWALKDISFDVKQGEAIGIIGRNGAGKSTLLKILSRITEPTKGKITINGRVASLLEVGTGFHPELTGRENVFLNGTILGMTRAEIKSKFDEIVDFSGVEKFIDTPVKHYSSGMYVRLGFAVAAHLDPEILIVDEVLAVGDAEFQKKCIGKMKDVSEQGRTVFFVSHNMAAVKSLCVKGLVLQQGKVVFNGSQMEAVQYYQNSYDTNSRFKHEGKIEDAPGNLNIRVLSFEVKPINGVILQISSGFSFELTFYNEKEGINLDTTFELRTADEVPVFHHGKMISINKDSKRGVYCVKGEIPPLLNAGIYKFNLIFGENQRIALFSINDFVQFEIMNETTGSNASILPGIIRPDIKYTLTYKNCIIGKPVD